MKNKYLGIFHANQNFNNLTRELTEKRKEYEACLDYVWFKLGVHRVWKKDKCPKLNNQFMRECVFSIIKNNDKQGDQPGKFIITKIKREVSNYMSRHVERFNSEQEISKADVLYLFDLVDARLKFDDSYIIPDNILVELIKCRMGLFPYNIHPVFDRMNEVNVMQRHLSRLQGIRDNIRNIKYKELNNESVFRYLNNVVGNRVHQAYDWCKLFGSFSISFKEKEQEADKLSEGCKEIRKKIHDGIDAMDENMLRV